ncbi:MAG: O-succinylbenzoic acid--CoA ligase [Glaciecola sp.]|jgi:O-succinylbenzoic acid--CoA ligase
MSTADLVAIRAPTAAQFGAAWDRVHALGDAVLPLDPNAPDEHNADLLRRLRPAALLTPYPGRPDELRTIRLENAAKVPAGTDLVIATSGSTGVPKGVVISREALKAATAASVRRLSCVDGDPWLLCLPWHHIAGLATIRRSRAVGAEPVLHDRFDADDVAMAISTDAVRWVSLVPTQLARLLDAGAPLSRLRGVLLGGAKAEPGLLERARDADVRVTVSYGMTEMSGGCVYNGEPLGDTSIAVTDDGRIRLSGASIADGYHLDDDATAASFEAGNYLTDDLGALDEHGKLVIHGRADDMIVSGGENVPASAVAAAISQDPNIEDVAVVGIPDPDWGRRVVAVAVGRGGAMPRLEDLRTLVGRTLPRSWAPRDLVVTDRLPRTSLGKIDRPAIERLARTALPPA